jgi:hypothetical protein
VHVYTSAQLVGSKCTSNLYSGHKHIAYAVSLAPLGAVAQAAINPSVSIDILTTHHGVQAQGGQRSWSNTSKYSSNPNDAIRAQ